MATTTHHNGTGHGRRFPEIILDTTLAELLAEEPGWDVKESLCNIKPCADPRHKTVPLNKKYLVTSTQVDDSDDLAHLQLENVSYLLSFWAGNMEVSLVGCEGSSSDNKLTRDNIDRNARRAFSVLNDNQRPWPSTFSNKDHFIQHYEKSRMRVRWGFAVDFAERTTCFVHPEVQYRLNSKRWLAQCSLRSANDRIIDPECVCANHTTRDGLWYFSSECDNCNGEVEKEVSRLSVKLQNTEPPFVLKITQSLGSVGTMLVKNMEDREQTIKQITQVQKESLPYVTADNAHIYPVSLVLSDFLSGETNALNFYVRRNGSVKFLGACQQLSTRTTEGGRQHTALTWDRQEKLEAKFKDTLSEIGQVLHEQGYFGPCGADVMEAEDGTQYVIDLNVRTSTSTILGCLRGHCAKRNFNVCAVYECILLNLSLDDLEDEFEREFEEGRLIVMGSTKLGEKNVYAYPVVLAGEDLEAVKALSEKILKFEAGGGDDAQDAGGG